MGWDWKEIDQMGREGKGQEGKGGLGKDYRDGRGKGKDGKGGMGWEVKGREGTQKLMDEPPEQSRYS